MLDSIRPWIEILYFFSSIILAAIGFYGAQQIRLLKKDMRNRAERAAKEKAIEFASRFGTTYVQLQAQIVDEWNKKGISKYMGPVGDFTKNSISQSELKDVIKRVESRTALWAINELDCIASAFVNGVASEQTGFAIFGRSFCAAVAFHYDVIANLCDMYKTVPHLSSIVSLYKLWASRLSKVELEESRKQLDEQIKGIRDEIIPGLGLNDKSSV